MSHAIKWIFIACLCVPITLYAQATPYFRLMGGQSYSSPGQTRTITFTPLYWKTDIANNDLISPLFIGFSAGGRVLLSNSLEAEIGVGYYQIQSFTLNGKVYQYSTPEFYNMDYHYALLHRSLMLEGKLITCYASIYHPYLSAGIGANRNTSYAYQETAFQDYAVPDPAFSDATQTSFAYSIGFGLDIDVAEHWRVGAGYQYTNLGAAKLGTAQDQLTSDHIHVNRIYANQFMLEAVYAV